MKVDKPGVFVVGGLILLQVVFLFLKVFEVINWDWLWVLSPVWIPYAAVIGILLVMFSYIVVMKTIDIIRGR